MRASHRFLALVCAGAFAAAVRGGETSDGKSTATTEEQTEEYKNWIELGIGGVITSGDRAQFEQEHRLPGDQPYGGIQDLHFEGPLGKDGLFSVDGHAIWDTNDYDVTVQLSKPKLGYIKAGFTEFRSWYDGNGGFFPHNDVFFPPTFPEMHIDRGEAWIELGLRVPDWPEITIRYTHEFRDGQKDSTIWGDTNLTGLPVNPTRKIVAAFRDIDETRDIFAFDALKTFGNTDVNLGMRYEHSTIDDSLNLERGAGQLPPVVPPPGAQRFITQRDVNNLDLFSGHAITETRIRDWLWFTAGYSYTTLGSDIGGSRVIGTHFDADFGEPVPTLRPFDHGFINLAGTSQVVEHIFNANVLWMPLKDLTILTAFRYTHDDRESDSIFLATDAVPNVPPFTPSNPQGGAHPITPVPVAANASVDYNRFGQRLEVRYDGLANWLFYAAGEWEEEFGNRLEHQSEAEEAGFELLDVNEDTSLLYQKYMTGVNWYPMMRLNLSAQYYHKIASYDNTINAAIHQRLVGEDWNTDDFNVRITCRPKVPAWLGTLALVTRYDFVHTTIDSQWAIFSDEELLNEEQSGVIKHHVISEALTWNPLARFYLQANFSYIFNQTDTPANNIDLIPNTSPTVVNFRNDYWTVTSGVGYIIDDKTDFYVDYSFYCANDYFKNPAVAVPYGSGATEHTVSASITRQLTKNTRLLLRYGYYNYRDVTSGGHNNYRAHSLYSGLQVRF
ncbi:MAG TPA: hypothetical protein VFU08_10955 [Candidatus Udaeobacter sp.]|nr:hypothetical protein [Candidatus Udaeobacter sp.]